MLPFEWMNIVPVDQLQPGDFAFLLDEGLERVFVGTWDSNVVVAYPENPEATIFDVQSFDGNVLLIRDWQIEVDHTQAKRFDHFDHMDGRIGSLMIENSKVVLTCATPHGRSGYISLPIRDTNLVSGRVRYAFPAWRIFKMDGDEKVELYKHALPAV